jgi:hypothetical protein
MQLSPFSRMRPPSTLDRAEQAPRREESLLRKLAGGAFVAGSGLAALTAPAQAQVQIQQPQPGTLYLSDFFENNGPDQLSHGEIVYRSARQLGFEGEMVRSQVPENPLTRKAHKIDAYLDQRQFSPEEMRQFLSDYSMQCVAGQTQSATQDLRKFLDEGAHHSAINLSRGCSQAQAAEAIYSRVSAAFNAGDPVAGGLAARRLAKIAPGLDSKVEELTSSDPAVRGPARLHFQQQLVDLVNQAVLTHPNVKEAQQDYEAVVAQLAERKVSVVVAAANSGEVLDHFAADAGARVQVPADFWRNRLATDSVVTVGATRMRDGQRQVTEYTNYDSGIDFYADGDAYVDPQHPDKLVNYGTSFAAPRLGAVLAHTHQQQPEWSNAQVEAFVSDQLAAKQLDLKGHSPASALDSARAGQYLKK